MAFIPYGKQWIDDEDIQSVIETLTSDYLTTGPKVTEFEEAVANYCGARYGVAVSNGTAALHIASLALLEPGDKVLTTPNSFMATSNAICYAGAQPIFVDIQPNGNINLDLCEEALKKDPSIKALYAVHFSGNPVEQKKLADIKEKYGITILEDCAHSIGASYQGIKAGNCQYSDASILSFHPVKHITSAEGGMVTTNDEKLYKHLLRLRNHGMKREEFTNTSMAFDKKGNINPWYYEIDELGFNYRLTDVQCALGLSQLSKLDRFVERRRKLARHYDQAFAHHSIVKPLYTFDGHSSYHLYVVLIDFDQLSITKAELFYKMREKGIGLQLHYIPINKLPYYQKLGYGNEETPVMDTYYQQCLSLPLYPKMSDEEQNYVIDTFFEVLNG